MFLVLKELIYRKPSLRSPPGRITEIINDSFGYKIETKKKSNFYPNKSVFQRIDKRSMDGVSNSLNGRSISQDDTINEIWLFSPLLCEDFDQIQVLPQLLDHIVQVELHVTADDDCVGCASQTVNLLDRNLIDFVIDLFFDNENNFETCFDFEVGFRT